MLHINSSTVLSTSISIILFLLQLNFSMVLSTSISIFVLQKNASTVLSTSISVIFSFNSSSLEKEVQWSWTVFLEIQTFLAWLEATDFVNFRSKSKMPAMSSKKPLSSTSFETVILKLAAVFSEVSIIFLLGSSLKTKTLSGFVVKVDSYE